MTNQTMTDQETVEPLSEMVEPGLEETQPALTGEPAGVFVFDAPVYAPEDDTVPVLAAASLDDTLPAVLPSSVEPEWEAAPVVEPAAASAGPAAVFSAPPAPPAPAAAPAPAPTRAPWAPTRWEFFGLVIGASLLTLLLSLVLSLGLLGLFNGGLAFASTAEVDSLSRQLDSLQTEATGLRQDLAAAEARLEGLTGLEPRVGAVESEAETLRGLVETRQRELDALTGRIATLNDEVDNLAERSAGFSRFLDGLRDLLNAGE